MKDKDTNSIIAYIFNEMDPSEEVEFERELQTDNNLLIEVESLKNAKNRLNKLPVFSPPDEVVNSVKSLASKKAKESKRRKQYTVYSAVAAVLVVGFMSGVFLYDSSAPEESGKAMVGSSNNLQQVALPARQEKNLSPWVDQNEILRFTDQLKSEEKETFDTVFKHSFQKLTPVTDPVQARVYRRDLQLTGSNR